MLGDPIVILVSLPAIRPRYVVTGQNVESKLTTERKTNEVATAANPRVR
jgi:hypothetical protein